MITKFKIFESINEDKPKLNDWVICKLHTDFSDSLEIFLSSNIGQLIDIGINNHQNSYYVIHFETEIPNNIRVWFTDSELSIEPNEIKYWSEDRTELERILDAQKYNI